MTSHAKTTWNLGYYWEAPYKDAGGGGGGGWRVCVCRWGLWGNKVEPKYPGIPTPLVRISVLKRKNC